MFHPNPRQVSTEDFPTKIINKLNDLKWFNRCLYLRLSQLQADHIHY